MKDMSIAEVPPKLVDVALHPFRDLRHDMIETAAKLKRDSIEHNAFFDAVRNARLHLERENITANIRALQGSTNLDPKEIESQEAAGIAKNAEIDQLRAHIKAESKNEAYKSTVESWGTKLRDARESASVEAGEMVKYGTLLEELRSH